MNDNDPSTAENDVHVIAIFPKSPCVDENGVIQKDLVNLPENQSVKVIIEDGVKEIGNRAFEGCKGLASVTLPASVTSIGHCAFGGCAGLTSVTLPARVTSIGHCAFEGRTGLTAVTIRGGEIESRNLRIGLSRRREIRIGVLFREKDRWKISPPGFRRFGTIPKAARGRVWFVPYFLPHCAMALTGLFKYRTLSETKTRRLS